MLPFTMMNNEFSTMANGNPDRISISGDPMQLGSENQTPHSVFDLSSQTGQLPSSIPAALTDAEKVRLLQGQLVLLYHAHQCHHHEGQTYNAENPQAKCSIPNCQTMKNILGHMIFCQAGRNCTVSHCYSSWQILSHWKQCAKPECKVCVPLKRHICPATIAVLDQSPAVGSLHGQTSPKVTNSTSMHNTDWATQGFGTTSSLLSGIPASVPSNSALALFSAGGKPNAFPGLHHTGPQPHTRSPEVPAFAVPNTKEWHYLLQPDVRCHNVHKIVQVIFPSPDSKATLDKRMSNLVAYAKNVESELFQIANSQTEYYHLLLMKMNNIQKELDEKRQRRNEQQRPQTQLPIVHQPFHSTS